MKLQYLIVIFAIIVIPLTMVLSYYINLGNNTILLQTSYESRLGSSTYGALKTFQLNTMNSYSNIVTEKIRYVEASVNTFFKTLGESFRSSRIYCGDIKTICSSSCIYHV